MKLTLDHPKMISLAAGFTDNASLPLSQSREILAGLLEDRNKGLPSLQYGPGAGSTELRMLTADRLENLDRAGGAWTHRLNYSAQQTLITHGSQQLLYLLAEALCDEGDIVLVESPTYFVFLGIAQSRAIRCIGIPMTPQGIDLGELESTLRHLKATGDIRRVKMLYLVTCHQNPTGINTSWETKRKAAELVRRYERHAGHPIYVLEDAAYRELRFKGKDVPSLLSLHEAGERVIYAGTYSKPFATGIRVGFGVLPEPLFKVTLRIKGNHDFGTAHLLQHVLSGALKSKAYDGHLDQLRKRYAAKAAVMKSALDEHFPEFANWEEPDGGLYYWVRLPTRMRTGPRSAIFQRALASDVLYVPGEFCHAPILKGSIPRCEMRLSFGGADEALIPKGIERLRKALIATG